MAVGKRSGLAYQTANFVGLVGARSHPSATAPTRSARTLLWLTFCKHSGLRDNPERVNHATSVYVTAQSGTPSRVGVRFLTKYTEVVGNARWG